MIGRYLTSSNKTPSEGNIYADKSALILDWLLRIGIDHDQFTIREVAKVLKVSLGLVQRVFHILVLKGLLKAEGIRTQKRFSLNNPHLLLQNWVENYNIVKKCKIWTYRSSLEKKELHKILDKTNPKITLALHSAAEELKCKNTNLDTLELYLLDSTIKSKLEGILQLEPQERGYEVLLIEPYYKTWLDRNQASPPLLTFLDLYHFPLRGQEQAEFMAQRLPELKKIYKKWN